MELYSYVEGDPITYADPSGLIKCGEIGAWDGGPSIEDLMTGTSELSLLVGIMWHEAGVMWQEDTWATIRTEQLFIGTAIMNRLDMSLGQLVGYGSDNKPYQYQFGNTLSEVILNAGGNNRPSWGIFADGKLAGEALAELNKALRVDVGSPRSADDILARSRECASVVSAIFGMGQIVSGVRLDPPGGIALFWNSGGGFNEKTAAAAMGLNAELINFGRTHKKSGNLFLGLRAHQVRQAENGNSRREGTGRGGSGARGR